MTIRLRDGWQPLERATSFKEAPEALVAEFMQHYSLTRDEALAKTEEVQATQEYWVNDVYQVSVSRIANNLVQINIRRRDGQAIFRDWRHFQHIKNDILGPECEAIELYPAESRLVDTNNKYHLWGCTDPSFRFPVGWQERDVRSKSNSGGAPGIRQRPIRGHKDEKHQRREP